MRRLRTHFVGMAVVAGFASSGVAQAAPSLRVQVDQRGDFLLIGNTLGRECTGEPPAPDLGSFGVDACIQTGYDNAPDLFWRSDAPEPGKALADISYQPADARTTAVLTVPAGATVTHAYLYWAAKKSDAIPITQVTVERPGTGGFLQTLTATVSHTAITNVAYESMVDVTALVGQYGDGAYRVGGISVAPFANVDDNTVFGAWAMVVFYERATDPLRNLALFDGMDYVAPGSKQSVTLSGFLVPTSGCEGKLGVIAYEGDATIAGDQLFFSGGDALTDNLNPQNDFFNSTRSWLGSPPTNMVGDLPQLKGTANSMAGVDLDVVDITNRLTPGQTEAAVRAESTGDEYYLGAFVTSITPFKPDFGTSIKTARDVNEGTLLTGDTLEYTITVTNAGNDAAVDAIVRDPLPAGVTYLPGSLKITAGVNVGALTDAADNDMGEYDPRTVTVRLGAGATGAGAPTAGAAGAAGTTGGQGGKIPIGGSVTITFQVKVDPGATGVISNQATVYAGGERGAPVVETVTDGNGVTPGTQKTDVFAEECDTNAQCPGDKPVCDSAASPRVCVACLADPDCGSTTSGRVCQTDHTCTNGCRGPAYGNGCPIGNVCTSTTAAIGLCIQCQVDGDCGGPNSGKICNATNNTCVDGCRGMGGNGCPTGDVCTSVDTTAGVCVDCLKDADCGPLSSGKVCDLSTNTCRDGCRGEGGNSCTTGVCTSTDATIGMCVECTTDANCGNTQSGRICNETTHSCQDGCRGMDGNGCPVNLVCTSVDKTAGACVQCMIDATCGSVTSGKVCDTSLHACRDGCRGIGGNGCPTSNVCSSIDTTIGYCSGIAGSSGVAGQGGQAGQGGLSATGGRRSEHSTVDWDDVAAQGNGCSCRTASQPTGRSTAWLFGILMAAGAMLRRQKRA